MSKKESADRKRFPGLFWLVVMFEFFERGAYYGMMSVLSVYFTDYLLFSKESVGVIKSVIQPILYFLPILAGALADRFGYRKMLTIAFVFLGGGYFLTSQFTTYTAVFLSLMVMAVGAGIFKPIISGTIARTTDESNSTMGFGIYYWSINLGAFLFPLILVPWLKAISWQLVIIAAAIATGAMIVPTLLFFRGRLADGGDPEPEEGGAEEPAADKTGLVQTVANAFEIIYSPFVLAHHLLRRRGMAAGLVALLSLAGGVWGFYSFLAPHAEVVRVSRIPYPVDGQVLLVDVNRDQSAEAPYALDTLPGDADGGERLLLMVYRPAETDALADRLAAELASHTGYEGIDATRLRAMIAGADQKITLNFIAGAIPGEGGVEVRSAGPRNYTVTLGPTALAEPALGQVMNRLRAIPQLAGLGTDQVRQALTATSRPPFLVPFIAILYFTSLIILGIERRVKAMDRSRRGMVILLFAVAMTLLLWLLPGLSVFARVLCTVIYLTLLSLFLMDVDDADRFKDHLKFLLMIFLYSGFWVLYFQMFDSVLWYVKAYVDATPLNQFVNGILSWMGIGYHWRFDIEHVTVINAGTIIALQLFVSRLVKKTRALPTMIAGIFLGTVGMAILAINTTIWVFIAGTVIFSIGEMTAHPKFISYVGLTAPRARKAMYMGYIFLYGVIGSSIGGVLGANLYVHFVDQLNQPRVLWLIFAGIGVVTIVGLLVYNMFFGRETTTSSEG